jgi:hypothetical protein
MALSRQSLSPTANLLRNSRLFSLPNPLPRPPVSETFGAGITKASDTATLPYPTHQAITTTKSSLARGDWGLKRPLPSRSHIIQTSDPVLRVTQLDTIEHVTDFDSAADHVRTRQKWEEMGVPMMKGLTQMRDQDMSSNSIPPGGAFEVRDDTTSYDTEMGLDEAGLYLKALKKSMPVERGAKAEWAMFNATWKEKWEAKKAAWRSRGWGEQLGEFEDFQKEVRRARNQVRVERSQAFERGWEAFRAPWDSKWAAKKEEWKALNDLNHPDRVAGIKAMRKEMHEEKAAFKQRWSEENAALPADQSHMPWLDEFLSFQKEQDNARKALRQRLSRSSSSDATPFTPFTPPGVDPIVHNTRRWKHDGPWLPGMGAVDFVAYLSKRISGQKKEFNAYLREYVKNEIYTTRRVAASASTSGGESPLDIDEAEMWRKQQESAWRNISNADVEKGIKALRKETASDPLASKLVSKLILPFLKLPAIKFKNMSYSRDASGRDVDKFAFDPETAPLSTHPSAGLGYLRTKSYIANHPILGPQSNPTPVPSRVVQARRTSTSNEAFARLGVAGFVANDQFRSTDAVGLSRAHLSNAKDVETIDIDTYGGKKILVQPLFGSVTGDGRIQIKLQRSTGPEVQVARGELDDRPPVRENYDANPFRNFAGSMGKSGVKELDEMSGEAQKFTDFLEAQKSPGRAQPGPGFPGMADALRGN